MRKKIPFILENLIFHVYVDAGTRRKREQKLTFQMRHEARKVNPFSLPTGTNNVNKR